MHINKLSQPPAATHNIGMKPQSQHTLVARCLAMHACWQLKTPHNNCSVCYLRQHQFLTICFWPPTQHTHARNGHTYAEKALLSAAIGIKGLINPGKNVNTGHVEERNAHRPVCATANTNNCPHVAVRVC